MGFLDMGMAEILLVIVIALIIWGPGRLPEIARTMGKAVSTLRRTSSELTSQIKRELGEEEDHPSRSMFKPADKQGESPNGDRPEAGSAGETNPKDE
ncbi:MAG: Sec-independent protein translocase protein TatB [Dehalococcoidales bacterium]|jgi:Tat protein translocase TatB subunit|nr:Sec-independent protein translocase protein TatB [Dehalococcoidales bacterium]